MEVDGCERMCVNVCVDTGVCLCVYVCVSVCMDGMDVELNGSDVDGCGLMRNCMHGCVRMWMDRDYIRELVDVYKCDLEISFTNS
jgi:hypothetical protein